MTLVGEKTILRAIEPSDADEYFKWINDESTNFYRGNYSPTSFADCRQALEDFAATPNSLTLIIAAGDGQTTLGLVGLRGICLRSRRAETWVYIGDPAQWGKGYATDAMRVLLGYAFDSLNLHRIWLECDPKNTGAVKVYERLGFLREGIHRDGYFKRAEYHDTITMGLVRTRHAKTS